MENDEDVQDVQHVQNMISNVENVLGNTAISSGNTIVICGIIVTLITGNILGIIFSTSVVTSALINVGLKKTLKYFFPNVLFFKRPEISKRGCGISRKCLQRAIQNPTTQPDAQGMPSGHSQTVAFASTFWILYIWRYLRHTKKYNSYMLWPSTIILLLLGISVMISRSFLVENCHSLPQILIGGLIGVALAFLFYWLIEKYKPSWLGEPVNQ